MKELLKKISEVDLEILEVMGNENVNQEKWELLHEARLSLTKVCSLLTKIDTKVVDSGELSKGFTCDKEKFVRLAKNNSMDGLIYLANCRKNKTIYYKDAAVLFKETGIYNSKLSSIAANLWSKMRVSAYWEKVGTGKFKYIGG